ncbi:hypothetical protein H6F38_23100 [Paenibacillus sp. EKM208P]|nr:hypothetical protein H6F38_23100 [Paenibacillus sp. EKM208P]
MDKSVEYPEELLYQNIFPYTFIPETAVEKKTFITMAFNGFQLVDNAYKSGYITLNVFTHKDLMKTDYGKTRTDFIIQEIDRIFNGIDGISIGKLQYDSAGDLVVNNSYYGMSIRYKMWEFNRL